jgi:hypothetical protein
MKTCSYDAFGDSPHLLKLLNAPFYGTAKRVKTALEANGCDINLLICKTGTLAKKKGKNITTSYVIANKSYTISVLIDGIQPENAKRCSAKDLFIQIIPDLKNYLNSK